MQKRYFVAIFAVSIAALLAASAALVVAVSAKTTAEKTARARKIDLRAFQADSLRRSASELPLSGVTIPSGQRSASESSPPVVTVPSGTLTVHDDGCGVIRSEFGEDPENLGWSVRDQDGFQVLQRNAKGETRYRYFRSGTYTVVLTAWGGETYIPISNEVTINC